MLISERAGGGAGIDPKLVVDGSQVLADPILATTAANNLRLWSPDSGELLTSHRLKPKGIYACAFSPDGALVAAASADNMARVWAT